MWLSTLGRVCLFLEIIILIIIAKYFKTMYDVLNTGSELSGDQKRRNTDFTLSVIIARHKAIRKMKGLQASICDIKLLQLRALLQSTEISKSLFSLDRTQVEETDSSEATAHLGGYLPPH